MTRQVVPPSPALNRNPTFVTNEKNAKPRGRRRAGEIAGVTTAECAAVCCCCPFTVMNILVLAVYKIPAGLCKKAIRRKKQERLQKKNKMLLQQQIANRGNGKLTLEEYLSVDMKKDGDAGDGGSEATTLEEEMWTQFHGTGFWRSPSQRQEM